MSAVDFTHFCQFVLMALLLGCAIGLERQWRDSVAGLRTNVLVAVGAAVFVLAGSLGGTRDSRIAAQIVSGIGFIGGGAILREGVTIRGVNTAATLWCSAAIGVLCGMGFLREASMAAGVILFSNTALRPITYAIRRRVAMRRSTITYYLCRFTCHATDEASVRKKAVRVIEQNSLLVRSIHSEATANGASTVKISLSTSAKNDDVMEKIVACLNDEESVSAISWELLDHPGDSE
jgi:putative Mg2+ transporter-C (MgtC) family protein